MRQLIRLHSRLMRLAVATVVAMTTAAVVVGAASGDANTFAVASSCYVYGSNGAASDVACPAAMNPKMRVTPTRPIHDEPVDSARVDAAVWFDAANSVLLNSIKSSPQLFNVRIACETPDGGSTLIGSTPALSAMFNATASSSPGVATAASFAWTGDQLPDPTRDWTSCWLVAECVWETGSGTSQVYGVRSVSLALQRAPEYNDGERMHMRWDYALIALSYFCSVFGSWVTLLLIDEAMDELRLQHRRERAEADAAAAAARAAGPGAPAAKTAPDHAVSGNGASATDANGTAAKAGAKKNAAKPKPPIKRGQWALWLAFAAVSLGGCAIWSMHFIGMSAASLGTDIYFSVGWTVGSILPPIAFAFLGFCVFMSRPMQPLATRSTRGGAGNVPFDPMSAAAVYRLREIINARDLTGFGQYVYDAADWRWAVATVMVASGVCVMHYFGTTGMLMRARISYDPAIVFASVVIALCASGAALLICFAFHVNELRFLASFIMGIAVCGMHYTGMHSMIMHFDESMPDPARDGIATRDVVVATAVVSLVVCLVFLVGNSQRQRFAKTKQQQSLKLARIEIAELQHELARAHTLNYQLLWHLELIAMCRPFQPSTAPSGPGGSMSRQYVNGGGGTGGSRPHALALSLTRIAELLRFGRADNENVRATDAEILRLLLLPSLPPANPSPRAVAVMGKPAAGPHNPLSLEHRPLLQASATNATSAAAGAAAHLLSPTAAAAAASANLLSPTSQSGVALRTATALGGPYGASADSKQSAMHQPPQSTLMPSSTTAVGPATGDGVSLVGGSAGATGSGKHLALAVPKLRTGPSGAAAMRSEDNIAVYPDREMTGDALPGGVDTREREPTYDGGSVNPGAAAAFSPRSGMVSGYADAGFDDRPRANTNGGGGGGSGAPAPNGTGVQLSLAHPSGGAAEANPMQPGAIEPAHSMHTVTMSHLLNNPVTIEVMKDVMYKSHRLESLLFYIDVQRFKRLARFATHGGGSASKKAASVAAQLLYATYIDPTGDGAPHQINIAASLVSQLRHSIHERGEFRVDMFDAPLKEIVTLMYTNTFRAFAETPAFEWCVQLLNASSAYLPRITAATTAGARAIGSVISGGMGGSATIRSVQHPPNAVVMLPAAPPSTSQPYLVPAPVPAGTNVPPTGAVPASAPPARRFLASRTPSHDGNNGSGSAVSAPTAPGAADRGSTGPSERKEARASPLLARRNLHVHHPPREGDVSASASAPTSARRVAPPGIDTGPPSGGVDGNAFERAALNGGMLSPLNQRANQPLATASANAVAGAPPPKPGFRY